MTAAKLLNIEPRVGVTHADCERALREVKRVPYDDPREEAWQYLTALLAERNRNA